MDISVQLMKKNKLVFFLIQYNYFFVIVESN